MWSHYQGEVLKEGIIHLLKGYAADMVWFLSLNPSVEAILDIPDSLYSSVSTFDIMMQGFFREFQGRSKSVAHYVMTFKGKIKWNSS